MSLLQERGRSAIGHRRPSLKASRTGCAAEGEWAWNTQGLWRLLWECWYTRALMLTGYFHLHFPGTTVWSIIIPVLIILFHSKPHPNALESEGNKIETLTLANWVSISSSEKECHHPTSRPPGIRGNTSNRRMLNTSSGGHCWHTHPRQQELPYLLFSLHYRAQWLGV